MSSAPPKNPDGLSRRSLLVKAAAAGGAAALSKLWAGTARADERDYAAAGRPRYAYAYVGSFTAGGIGERGEGISTFKVDLERGTLELIGVFKSLANPGFLAISRDRQYLYTVAGDLTDVSALKIDQQTGGLTLINTQNTQGTNPNYLALDPSGRFLVLCNHVSSSLAVFPVNGDGSLGAVSQLVTLTDPLGPQSVEQTSPKPHATTFDPSGRFVIVPEKGSDRVRSYLFDGGQLTPAATPFVATRQVSGPRHVAFHPTAQLAYVINELGNSVTAYRFDPTTGALEPFQWLSSLPDTFTGDALAAELIIDSRGRYLYASNRSFTVNTIAVFAVDETTGRLSKIQDQPTGGAVPRFIAFAPGERFIFALNQFTNSIVTLARDPRRGTLTSTGASVSSGSPVSMVFSI